MSDSKALQVSDVTKSFSSGSVIVEVLRGISFSLEAGANLAVTGPSGSGKSTLLHLIGTLDSPTSGQIEIGGRDPFAMTEVDLADFRSRVIGFVFQDHHLLPQYTVLENVLIPCMALRDRQAGTVERASSLLERVGLGPRLDHRPAALSGGERQRAAVARALINKPSLLLCDEPTGSLDSNNSEAVADLLFELHEQEGAMLIGVTHSAHLAKRFDRHFELQGGRCLPV